MDDPTLKNVSNPNFGVPPKKQNSVSRNWAKCENELTLTGLIFAVAAGIRLPTHI